VEQSPELRLNMLSPTATPQFVVLCLKTNN